MSVLKITDEFKLTKVPVTFHGNFFNEYSIDNTRIKTTTPWEHIQYIELKEEAFM